MKVNGVELFEINGVEIFAVGTHKGDKYTTKDLDEMVNAYNDVGFIPPVKQGHAKDETGMPALGWVHNLRRVGNKLLADFKEVPKTVYNAIKQRRYDRVSSEIYFHFQNGKKIFARVLKAVALLGAEIPAVRDLKPLRNQVYTNAKFKWETYDLEELHIDDFTFTGEITETFINKLPDEAFAFILPGGTKDEEGRTTPFSSRMFPHHDIDVQSTEEQKTVNTQLLHSAGVKLYEGDLPTADLAKVMAHLRFHYEFLFPPLMEGTVEERVSRKRPYLALGESMLKEFDNKKIQIILAELQEDSSLSIQSLLFGKEDFNLEEAKQWAENNNFKFDQVDVLEKTIRLKQKNSSKYKPGSFRVVKPGKKLSEDIGGVKVELGKIKTDIESNVTIIGFQFEKKSWDKLKALEWLSNHGLEKYKDVIINDGVGDSISFQNSSNELQTSSFRSIPLEGATFKIEDLIVKYNNLSGGIKMEARIAKLEELLKSLQNDSTKKLSEKDSSIESLRKEIEALNKIVELSEGDTKSLAEFKASLEKKEKTLSEKEESYSEIEKKNFALEESIREGKIATKVADVKLPALRKYFKVFYDAATGKDISKVFKFSVNEKEEKELSLEKITDGFAATMNKLAESKIFSELSTMPEFSREDRPAIDNPKAEVDKRTKEYMAKNKEEDYEVAFNAILSSDPQLKEAYAASA